MPGSGSSLWVFLNSWGPDDDGKTVDGPHQLGKVTVNFLKTLRDPGHPHSVPRRILQVAPSPTPLPSAVPGLCHLALPPPFRKSTPNWGMEDGAQILREK